jgi:lysophospholipase L1-like esterase
MKSLILLVLLSPLLSCSQGFRYPDSKAKAWAFFGDSFTEGVSGANYPNHFTAATGIPIRNYGTGGTRVCGNTYAPVNGGHDLIDKYQTEIALGYTGQAVSFQYGTNDIGAGVVNAQWKTTYKSIIQAFINAGWPLRKLLIIVQPNYSTSQASRLLARRYAIEIARELNILCYNAFDSFNSFSGGNDVLFKVDNVHPNPSGDSLLSVGVQQYIIK